MKGTLRKRWGDVIAFKKNRFIQKIFIFGDSHGNITQIIKTDGEKSKNDLPHILSPVETYIGHEEDLEKVYKGLLDGKDAVILTGLGGIGKTEFTRFFGFKFFKGKCYYLNFRKSVIDTFLDYGQLNLSNQMEVLINGHSESDSFAEIIWSLCDILDKDDLLVIDNVTNLDGIYKIFQLPCHMILTTRLSCESVNLSTCMKYDLPSLKEQECVLMFQRYYNGGNDYVFTSEEENTILKIVQLVGCHTLTIELLAKTCSKAYMNIGELLNRLEKYGFSLGEESVKVTKNNDIENKTLLEHMQKLFDITDILSLKGAKPLLKQLSVLRLEGLEIECLKDILQLADLNVLNELADYGWIKIRNGKVFMHNVVSQIIKSRLNPNYNDLKRMLGVLNLKMNMDRNNDKMLDIYVEQAVVLVQYLKDVNNKKVIRKVSAKLGKILYYKGKWHESEYYFRRCISDYKRCFFQNPLYIADIYSDIGSTYKALGQYDFAMQYYDESLSIRKRWLRKDDPVFGKLYNNIAAVYYQQRGDYEKVMDYLIKAKYINEKAYGVDSEITAVTYNYLGVLYRAVEDYEKAKYYLENKALPIQLLAYGENTSITAETTNNLAGVYRRQGDYAHALELYKRALEIRKRILGPEHPDTATSYNNIGLLYLDIGNWDLSIEYCNQAVLIFEEAVGKNHPYIATVYHNLSRAYIGKNNYIQAKQFSLMAKEIKEKKYSATNPILLSTYKILAQIYEQLGEQEEAALYYGKIRENIFG